MQVHQACRFALDPTSRQEQMLRSHAGAARFAWNWELGRCNERYEAERRWYSAAETRNRRLARAIADQGFGQVRRMLGYKARWNGGRIVLADRFYPSSKTCSGCGTAKAKLSLSERTFRCDTCGLVTERDVNAARNMLYLAASGAGRLNDCGGTVRPRLARRVPEKQEPGTLGEDKTGTVPRQRGTADER